jgi:hypothetical protein
MPANSHYASYLLRLWQVHNDQHTTWVASVQNPTTGEKRPFASVEALIHFLQAEFGDCNQTHDVEDITSDTIS